MKLHIHTGAKGLRAFSHDRTVTITIPRKRKPARDAERAAGVAYFNEEGAVLLCKRSDGLGWSFPAGGQEPGETPAEAARREFKEETGRALPSLAHAPSTTLGNFTVFLYQGSQFEPLLCAEHSEHDWFDPEHLPEGTHKGVREELDALGLEQLAHKLTDRVRDAEFDESEHPRDTDGKFAANGGSSSKPTKATAKGSKAGVHELLTSGHAFTVEELMEATGTTNRSTIMTALSDLKSPKYAGALGHLSIAKRSDGTYHVIKEQGGPATSAKPTVKQEITEPTVVRVERTDMEGTKHWVKLPGDDREWPLVRVDSTQGLGPVWGAAIGGAWEKYAEGPTPSQNGYINQGYIGDNKEDALKRLPGLIKRLDASPHYSKVTSKDDRGITKEWWYDRKKGDYVVTFTDPNGYSELGEVYRTRSHKEASEMTATSLGLQTKAEQDAALEARYGGGTMSRFKTQEPVKQSEPYTGPAYHMIESDDEFTHHVMRYPEKKRVATHSSMERAHRVREELDKSALKEHVAKLGREQAATKLEWKKHDWMNSSHTTLTAGHKATKAEYSNGDIGYTVQGGGSVYKHVIRTDADGNVQYHNLETPHTTQSVKGPVQSTSQKRLNPNQAAKFASIYKELGLVPWHKQQKP